MKIGKKISLARLCIYDGDVINVTPQTEKVVFGGTLISSYLVHEVLATNRNLD